MLISSKHLLLLSLSSSSSEFPLKGQSMATVIKICVTGTELQVGKDGHKTWYHEIVTSDC